MSELLRQKSKVKIRKKHNCFGCLEILPVGAEVDIQVVVDSGSCVTLYFHPYCKEIMDEIFAEKTEYYEDVVDWGFMNMLREYDYTDKEIKDIEADLQIEVDKLNNKVVK